jgi:5'-3' exonuclease
MFYVIDASIYVFRAWFSIPDDMQDGDGNSVNALYGFTRFLGDFLEYTRPDHVAVAFDSSLETCFRNDIYPAYKANREPAPAELKQQFERCRQVARALGLADFAEQRFEADDIIGTLVMSMRQQGMRSTIVTRDKDMSQLLDAGDMLWDYASGRRIAYKDVRDSYGARAEQMVDFLALAGDSVDNIPGVRGVGPKTATALLDHFDSLDDIYARLDEVAGLPIRGAGKLGARLAAHKEDAILSRRLSAIACDVPMDTESGSLLRQSPDLDGLGELYDRADFGQALRRQAERIAEHF